MTVIAFRAGVMACDSCWADDCDNVSALQTKIKRTSWSVLIGSAGDSDSRAIEDMLSKIRSPNHLPSREALGRFECDGRYMVVFPKSERIFEISTTHIPASARSGKDNYFGLHEVPGEFYAIGSGSAIALGAMEAGATAIEACRITCRRNVWCRPPIHQLGFTPKGKVAPRK